MAITLNVLGMGATPVAKHQRVKSAGAGISIQGVEDLSVEAVAYTVFQYRNADRFLLRLILCSYILDTSQDSFLHFALRC